MMQTGGKQGTVAPGQQTQQLRMTGMDQGGAAEYNPYAEDPRPNLFNIVKNIRENKRGYMRVLYAARLADGELKGDVESKNRSFIQDLFR
jgi:hypothetical protein